MATRAAPVALLLAALGLTGCGGQLRAEDAATEAATRLAGALRAGDGEAACKVLAASTVSELEQSSKKPCASAVLEEVDPPAPTGRTDVYGAAAVVRTSTGPVFLSRFAGGWRVVAVECTPAPPGPYDCAVQGG